MKSSVEKRTAGHKVAHENQAVAHHRGNGIHAGCGQLGPWTLERIIWPASWDRVVSHCVETLVGSVGEIGCGCE